MLIERGVIKSNISVVEDGEYKKIGCQQRVAYFYINGDKRLMGLDRLP